MASRQQKGLTKIGRGHFMANFYSFLFCCCCLNPKRSQQKTPEFFDLSKIRINFRVTKYAWEIFHLFLSSCFSYTLSFLWWLLWVNARRSPLFFVLGHRVLRSSLNDNIISGWTNKHYEKFQPSKKSGTFVNYEPFLKIEFSAVCILVHSWKRKCFVSPD